MSQDMNEPFEEFQFKPLTQGLGFHKKATQTGSSQILNPEDSEFTFSSKNFKTRGLDLIEDEKSLDFRAPLSRQKKSSFPEDEILSPTSAAVDEILNSLNKNRPYDKAFNKKSNGQARATQPMLQSQTARTQHTDLVAQQALGIEKSSVNLFAGFLDGMMIIAGTLLGFIVLLSVNQIDLLAQLSRPVDFEIYFASLAVFVGVSIVYYLATRMFLGCSPGEWAYDQQLGTKSDQSELSYAPLIVIRTCLALVTGIVFFPMLSALFGRDLLGRMMGLELHKKA